MAMIQFFFRESWHAVFGRFVNILQRGFLEGAKLLSGSFELALFFDAGENCIESPDNFKAKQK